MGENFKINSKGKLNIGRTSWLKGKIGIIKRSEETRRKISENNGMRNLEVRERQRQTLLSRKLKHTEEWKKQQGIRARKLWENPDYRRNMNNKMLGRKPTLGMKLWANRDAPFKGRKHTEACKEAKRQSRLCQIFPQKDTKPEKMVQIALALEGIPFEKHKPIYGQPDIYIEPRTCIFIDGRRWHADPRIYKAEEKIIGERTAQDIWNYDKKVTKKLEQQGYLVIRLWETDIMKDVGQIAKNVISQIQIMRLHS